MEKIRYLTILTLLLSSSVRADDPFEHFDWQNQINVSYSKPWMSFVHAYIGSKSSHLTGLFAKFNSKLSITQMISLLASRQSSKKLIKNVGILLLQKVIFIFDLFCKNYW